MVRFGKRLRADQVEEWRGYYINYKLMKKKVKQYTQLIKVGAEDRQQVMSEFSKILDDQIEKIVLFILEQQGLLALCLSRLGEQRQSLAQEADVSHMAILREAYREIGLDLLKLVKFVELNATGIRKILKKFDKRFGYKFTDHYVTTRANHPYSQIQQVFKHVGVGAVVGALSRNLAEIQEHQGSFSIYDHPHLVLTDPVIESIKVSIDKLTRTTSPIQFLGQHAMIIQEELPIAVENSADDESYHPASLLLNLGNTFLYMVNTYIIVPTADDYAMSLGAAATVCGVIIGSMAVAQIFSSVYFSAWFNRSYFRPLVFSSIILLVGNIMYATAFDLNSIAVLLIGRLLCGLGSARAVNRRYISDCVPLRKRMQASAGFVSASALGMACGPALAGLLQTKGKILGFSITASTLPGWVMAFAWFINLLCLWMFFQEPVHDIDENDVEQGDFRENVLPGTETSENGLVEPLICSDTKVVDNDDGENFDESEEGSEDSRKPATSIASAYRLLTPSIKVQLLIYFMLKFAIEILISASSVVTSFYFQWSTSNVALFLALLGFTVLPVNVMVGSYISNIFEERKILLASEIMVLVGVALSFHFTTSYTVLQYVLSAFVTFVAAEVLEGVNLSLLSQVMSSRLARGTFNGGLLSTEAGTIARVMADLTITLAGNLGMGHLLNTTLLPSFLFCVLSVIATFLTYNSLY